MRACTVVGVEGGGGFQEQGEEKAMNPLQKSRLWEESGNKG